MFKELSLRMIPLFVLMEVALLSVFPGCNHKSEPLDTKEGDEMTLSVSSSAFGNGEPIPRKYSGEGQDVSPPLKWEGAPENTKSYVLICDDPDAPRAEPWVHWVLYNIPPGVTSLKEDSSGTGTEGLNSWDKTGYGGPMPPPGHGTHHYHFKVYALDSELSLKAGAAKQEVLDAISGHVLAQGELVGAYER